MEIKQKLSQAGPLERKREQVFKSIDKNAFLDVLMGGSKSIPVHNAVKSDKPVEQTNDNDKVSKAYLSCKLDLILIYLIFLYYTST